MNGLVVRATQLAIVLILAVGAPTAVAQSFTCIAYGAVPPTVRAGGLAEQVGDVVLDCNGNAPASGIVATVSVTANTALTGRLLSGNTSEALLLIGEPAAGAQALGVNLFEGLVSGNTVSFPNVPLVSAPGGTIVHRILRITNLRVNVNPLGVPAPLPLQVTAVAAIDGTPLPVAGGSPSIVVAFVAQGPVFSVAPQRFAECLGPVRSVDLTFAEGVPVAFKMRGAAGQSTPGQIYHTETGFTPTPAISGVGTADSGTQLSVTFKAIPNGVQLSVPPTITNGTLTVTAVSPMGGGQIPIVGGVATVIYEVTAANPLGSESIVIPVTVAYSAGASVATGIPVTVNGNLAPISTIAVASSTAPIPRFVDMSAPTTAFSIDSCPPVPTTSRGTLVGLCLLLLGFGAMHFRQRART